MSENAATTLKRAPSYRELRNTLRRLREATRPKISAAAAARHINVVSTTITRYEKGEIETIKPVYVRALCELYGAPPEIAARLSELAAAQRSATPQWWEGFGDGSIPKWFRTYLGLEDEACRIAEYGWVVPGILQTEEYARHALSQGPLAGKKSLIEEQVAVRLRRQKILDRELERRPTLEVFLDESVLRRPVGGRAVLGRQLLHLVEASDRANVTIRVAEFEADAEASAALYAGPFIVLDFVDDDDPGALWLEHPVGALVLDDEEELTTYRRILARLNKAAASEKRSRELMKQAAAGLLGTAA